MHATHVSPHTMRSTRLWTGAILRTLRHHRRFTQNELAARAACSDTTWSRYEQGTLPLPTALASSAESWLQVPPGFIQDAGVRICQDFQNTPGTAAWRFRMAGVWLSRELAS